MRAHPFVSFSIFLILLGFIGGGLLRFYQETHLTGGLKRTFSTEEIARSNRLNRRLHRIEAKNSDLEAEIALLNHHIRQRSQDAQQQQYSKLEDFLGLHPKEGNGLEIVLEDSPRPVRLGENPNIGIVHNIDLLVLVNQLWASGAKAIAINQQRIMGTSEITCAGPIIMVNKSRISSPFVIEVVGRPKRILRRLNKKDSYLKYLAAYGIRTVVHPKFVKLPPYLVESN